MDSSGHLPKSESAARRLGKSKARKSRPRPRAASRSQANGEHPRAAVGTLSRTKSLLLAALRVWELKQQHPR